MRGTIIPAAELSHAQIEQWSAAQLANPLYDSPCFRPELIREIGCLSRNVFVAVIEARSDLGFLAFRRNWNPSVARPIATVDYQGIVVPPNRTVDVSEALRACGLSGWYFRNLIAPGNEATQADACTFSESPRVVLRPDFAAYLADMKSAGRSMRHIQSQTRFLERDYGPLRFTPLSDDAGLLPLILARKAERYRGGAPQPPWLLPVMQRIHAGSDPRFCGVLSTLCAGDRLVAAHFGMRSGGVLHFWLPMFDPEFSRYSPGKLLIYHLIRNLAQLGCDTLDFGPGDEDYKSYFGNASIPVAAGCYERRSLGLALERSVTAVYRTARRRLTPLRPLVRRLREAL